ncbi:MAG: hypothetical protein PHZ02_01415 [Desulfocapsaceae bacterium]|nr:hypothetical protein [Desulfocapsaceae bacterium]
MLEIRDPNIVVNCPNCGKEYNMDEYYKLKDDKEHEDNFSGDIYNPKICSACNIGFGIAKIIGIYKGNTRYSIELDLIEPKDTQRAD